jgi:hypothetical protein
MKLRQQAHGIEKVIDPSNFLPLWQQASKSEEKKKESTNSLLVPLDVIPVNVLATTSPASTSNHPCITVIIVVVRVDTCTSLMVSSSGVVSGMDGTPRLWSLMVALQGLLPICCSSLLLLLLLIIII